MIKRHVTQALLNKNLCCVRCNHKFQLHEPYFRSNSKSKYCKVYCYKCYNAIHLDLDDEDKEIIELDFITADGKTITMAEAV